MPHYGLNDIRRFIDKIRFILNVIPLSDIIEKANTFPNEQLTGATVEAWKQEINKPTRAKLGLFCKAIGLDMADIYDDFDSFVEKVSRVHNVDEKDKKLYSQKITEQNKTCLDMHIFSRTDRLTIEKIFKKIQGSYLQYNYAISNLPQIHISVVDILSVRYPFIMTRVRCFRDGEFVPYNGYIFPVRSNLYFFLEPEPGLHDEIVLIVTNNPINMAGVVKYLHGIVQTGSEDFVSHPSSAKIFMERFSEKICDDELKEKLLAMEKNEISIHCRRLIDNKIDPAEGQYVLRAEQLSIAYIQELLGSKK